MAILPWCMWCAFIARAHHVEGWDEGSYVLSGLALRGYHVPYASHRAPVTGFICAAFVGWERFLNPVLLAALLVVLYLWTRRLLGPIPAALSLLLLICQNLMLESTVEIMSELPAALLMLLGFFCLARERFWVSALCFALLVFTRWNLAPVWAVVFLAVLIRFGLRQALKFALIGLIIFSAWYGITISMRSNINWVGVPGKDIPNPLVMAYGNFIAGKEWAPNPDQIPNFLVRLRFYGKHCFFLTPFILFALIVSPIQNFRKHLCTELWTILVVLPIAMLSYLFTMLNMGALFPRFMAPLIPSAIVLFLCGILEFSHLFQEVRRTQIMAIAVFVSCAVGLWPLSAVKHVHQIEGAPAVFSPTLRKQIQEIDRTAYLYGIPQQPLIRNHANPAMVEARHFIFFPSASHDWHDAIVEEPESTDSVEKLAEACRPGDLLIIFKKSASRFDEASVVAADAQWAVIRKP